MVDIDAVSDTCSRVSGEVQVRHGVHVIRISRCDVLGKRVGLDRDLALLDAGDALFDHLPNGHVQEEFLECLGNCLGVDIALSHEFLDELLPHILVREGFYGLIHIVDDLYTVFPEDIGEDVMLSLSDLDVGDIVE